METLWEFPPQTRVDRLIPKSKIYQHAGARTALRDLFVKQVDKIIWLYKLSSGTVNISASEAPAEIEIIRICLKGQKLDEKIIRCIDEAIPHPIIFEIENNEGELINYVASYKPGSGKPGDYLFFDGVSEGRNASLQQADKKLPNALNINDLYSALLEQLLPLQKRQNETIKEAIDRARMVKNLKKQIAAKWRQIKKEKQFNKKVTLNTEVNALKRKLQLLSENEFSMLASSQESE